jgi:uncharacterized protein YjcR
METLEAAIVAVGGISRLAEKLGIRPNVISNWRLRNSIPRAWEMVLADRFLKRKPKRQTAEA